MVTVAPDGEEPGQTFKAPEGPVPVVHDGAFVVVRGNEVVGAAVVVGEVDAEAVLDVGVDDFGVFCEELRGPFPQPATTRMVNRNAARTRPRRLTMKQA